MKITKTRDGNTLRIALEGVTPNTHSYGDFNDYIEKYEHPLWYEYRNAGVKAGHGGMDWLVLCAFAEAVREDAEPPIDVYDTAAWMAITCLSEQSVAMGGMFVLETVSVILQVGSYKLTGKRIFRMAPIHHHFEKLGWPEPRVIVRFWIVTFMLVLLGLLTLKIR